MNARRWICYSLTTVETEIGNTKCITINATEIAWQHQHDRMNFLAAFASIRRVK